MKTKLLAAAGFFLYVAGSAFSEPPAEKLKGEDIAPGLVYALHQVEGLTAHVLRFTLNTPALHLRSLKASGKETLRTMVDRLNQSGERVVGAVNGDFFRRETAAGVPIGVQVSDEKLIFGPVKRSMIGFGKDNTPYIGIVELKGQLFIGEKKDPKKDALSIDGVNVFAREFKKPSGIILYTPAFQQLEAIRYTGLIAAVDKIAPALQVGEPCQGTVVKAEMGEQSLSVPPDGCLLYFVGEAARDGLDRLKPGVKVALQLSLPPIQGSVPQAIGGGPRLVRAGRKSVEFDKEDFTRLETLELHRKRHPRSAVGYDRNRKNLFLVMVEGRHEESAGMTMDELADFMIKLGCFEAMGFDGGGSAAMYVLGRGIASKSVGDGGQLEEREIANSLLITMERKFPPLKPADEKTGKTGEKTGQ